MKAIDLCTKYGVGLPMLRNIFKDNNLIYDKNIPENVVKKHKLELELAELCSKTGRKLKPLEKLGMQSTSGKYELLKETFGSKK